MIPRVEEAFGLLKAQTWPLDMNKCFLIEIFKIDWCPRSTSNNQRKNKYYMHQIYFLFTLTREAEKTWKSIISSVQTIFVLHEVLLTKKLKS